MLTCFGSVRGWCGHAHPTVEEAQECIVNDNADCASQGGYSDRCAYDANDLSVSVDGDYYIRNNSPRPAIVVGRNGMKENKQ